MELLLNQRAAPGAADGPRLSAPPSDWLCRWQHLLAPGARVLDLACGSGRHLRWLAGLGRDLQLTGVDRDAHALAACAPFGETVLADLEDGSAWPLAGRRFDAVLVANYLHRPLWPYLLESLAPAGLLVYETFAVGQETVGRPSRPEFLLRPGELLQRCAGLEVIGYEDGWEQPRADLPVRRVQRIVARHPDAAAPPARLPRGVGTGSDVARPEPAGAPAGPAHSDPAGTMSLRPQG